MFTGAAVLGNSWAYTLLSLLFQFNKAFKTLKYRKNIQGCEHNFLMPFHREESKQLFI